VDLELIPPDTAVQVVYDHLQEYFEGLEEEEFREVAQELVRKLYLGVAVNFN
jgi:hypothetical protein